MKVAYQVVGSGGNYTTLYDESVGQVSKTYKGTFKDKSEETPGFGSPSVGITPNANTSVMLEIPLSVSYASPDAAQAAIVAMRKALKGLRVNLQVTVGANVLYYPSGVLNSMTFDLSGCSVEYVLSFTTQDAQIAAP